MNGHDKLNPIAGWFSTSRRLVLAGVALVGILLLYLFRYDYEPATYLRSPTVIRTNRITGQSQILDPISGTWADTRPERGNSSPSESSSSSVKELPYKEREKITGRLGIEQEDQWSGKLKASLYNGSSWKLARVDIVIDPAGREYAVDADIGPKASGVVEAKVDLDTTLKWVQTKNKNGTWYISHAYGCRE